jgi:hypothetical protein
VRCDRCGARNAEGATWCTQCYASFTAPPAPAPVSPAPVSPERAGQERGGQDRDVRVVGGAVEWRCRRCEGWSALAAPTCTTCAAPRAGFGEEAATAPSRAVDPVVAVGASLLLPGAGHLLVGRTGTGAARAILWLLWVVPGIAALRASDGLRALPGLVLVLGAAALWAATLVDVRRAAEGDPQEVLAPRMLAWLVGGVVLAVVVAVLVATTTAR